MLSQYLKDQHVSLREGHIQQCPAQVETLQRLLFHHRVRTILEIGFNAGHSSEIFLESRADACVTSFDFGHHPCVAVGKQWLDARYPERHCLIMGDSVKTVPTYPDAVFDFVFIDGGHFYDTVCADLFNVQRLTHPATIVVLDDIVRTVEWQRSYTVGPTRAWNEWVESGKLVELGCEEYESGRGMAWGKFTQN